MVTYSLKTPEMSQPLIHTVQKWEKKELHPASLTFNAKVWGICQETSSIEDANLQANHNGFKKILSQSRLAPSS